MKGRIYIWLVVILIGTLVLASCASQPATEAPVEEAAVEETEEMEAEEPEEPTEEAVEPEEPTEEAVEIGVIKVGYMPISGFAPLFVAQELGYFADEGLEIEMNSFRTGDAMIAPLSLGQLDVGGGETGPALFNAVDQDLDVRVVGALASQPVGYGGVPLLVRKDLLDSGEVAEVADLEGLKVAINVERGMAEYLLAKALEPTGLTIDDVEIITLPFPEMPAAFVNAAIDAAILPHPLASKAIRPGENDEPPAAGVLIEGDQITDSPQNGTLYFGKRLLDPANHDVCVSFMKAFLKGARDFQGDEWRENDDIVNAFLEYTTVPEPAVRKGVIYYFDPNGQINSASTEDIQAYHVDQGYTELSEPLPLDQIVDYSCLEDALAELGEL